MELTRGNRYSLTLSLACLLLAGCGSPLRVETPQYVEEMLSGTTFPVDTRVLDLTNKALCGNRTGGSEMVRLGEDGVVRVVGVVDANQEIELIGLPDQKTQSRLEHYFKFERTLPDGTEGGLVAKYPDQARVTMIIATVSNGLVTGDVEAIRIGVNDGNDGLFLFLNNRAPDGSCNAIVDGAYIPFDEQGNPIPNPDSKK